MFSPLAVRRPCSTWNVEALCLVPWPCASQVQCAAVLWCTLKVPSFGRVAQSLRFRFCTQIAFYLGLPLISVFNKGDHKMWCSCEIWVWETVVRTEKNCVSALQHPVPLRQGYGSILRTCRRTRDSTADSPNHWGVLHLFPVSCRYWNSWRCVKWGVKEWWQMESRWGEGCVPYPQCLYIVREVFIFRAFQML